MRPVRTIIALALICVSLAACADTSGPAVVVGSANNIEQVVLGKLTAMLLDEHGYDVTERAHLGYMKDVRRALESERVDVCWAYSGQVWQNMLGHDQPVQDIDTLLRRINEDETKNDIRWLGPCEHTQSGALFASPSLASAAYSISGLGWHISTTDPGISVCVPQDMEGTVSGLEGLVQVYGLGFRRDAIVSTDNEVAYQGVSDGYCDCCLGYTDSVMARELGLVPLVDDLGFFPTSFLLVGANNKALADEHLALYLSALGDAFKYGALDDLVEEYSLSGQSDLVIRSFLRNNGLLDESLLQDGDSNGDS